MLAYKFIKIRPLTALLVCVWLVLVWPAQASCFSVGYFLVKPHTMPAYKAEPDGVAIHYFDLIAQKMGLTRVRYKLFPLKRLLKELEHGQIDMALLFAKNQKRAAIFVYPRKPIFVTQPLIAVHALNPLKEVRSVEALLPLTIGESAGAYRSPFIRDARLKIKALHGGEYTMRCYAMLMTGRIDACYQPDHYPIRFESSRNAHGSRIRVLPLPEPPTNIYSVFSKQSAKTYLKRYEVALEKVRQDITYEALFEKFMDAYVKRESDTKHNHPATLHQQAQPVSGKGKRK